MAVLESIVRVMSPRNRSKIPWPTLESIVRARSPRNRPKLPYLSCLPNALARGAFVCPSDAVRWGCGMQECPKMRLQMLVYSCGNGGGAEEKNESERKQRERGEGKEMRETEGGEFIVDGWPTALLLVMRYANAGCYSVLAAVMLCVR